ncbi:MAG: carbohydrate-binding domain-containing protein [Anaerolineae bacterium]|nr:carbohydrate-binding domain-containing protein [Anaerolineae bacterium]
MKKILSILILAMILVGAVSCQTDNPAASSTDVESVTPSLNPETVSTETITADDIDIDYDSEDVEESVDVSNATIIQLNGTSISVDGSGAAASGAVVTISSAGTYQLSGSLSDGQVIVDTTDEEPVTLVLAGVDITCAGSAPIFVANAGKVVLFLAANSDNVLTDGIQYIFAEGEEEPNAAVFSKDDLTICGTGALTVNANYSDGISSKDDLQITDGTITVNAVNDGIKGRDSITIKDGMIIVTAGADGLQANNDADPAKGNIFIEGGTIIINAELDGMEAENSLLISGGKLDITTGGGSVATSNGDHFGRQDWGQQTTNQDSQKGLKAGVDLSITGGMVTVSAYDDGLHANGTVTIEGGQIELASGDDGIHADTALTVRGGEIHITEAYEGLESAAITVYDGIITMVTSDDGINASTGNDGGMMNGGDASFTIHGGYIYVNAQGDGLDANGTAVMTGGVVLVNGPTGNGNGALDTGTFDVSGGFLVAVGSAGMATAPSTTSTQYSVLQNLNTTVPAGTLIHIEAASGESIVTFATAKEAQTIVVSSPKLANGESYVVSIGGQSSGEAFNGLYTDGNYNGGTEVASFTITSIITGYSGGGQPGGHPNRP